MKTICTINADSFPVGLAVTEDGTKLIVTSQGRNWIGGGNSVMIFSIKN